MTHKDIYILNSELLFMLHYVTNNYFADMIKVNDLEMGSYPGLPGWTNSSHMSPQKQNETLLTDVTM